MLQEKGDRRELGRSILNIFVNTRIGGLKIAIIHRRDAATVSVCAELKLNESLSV